jgi:hypothetical protein
MTRKICRKRGVSTVERMISMEKSSENPDAAPSPDQSAPPGDPPLTATGLERGEVLRDEQVARREVLRREHLAHPLHGHLEVTEASDDLRDRDLGERVAAVARARIDGGGLEQADLVVVPQRLDAEVGDAGEVSDREHAPMVDPPAGGESSATIPLDPPPWGERTVRT